MVESVGKKLNQARLQQGLTIDEAAHATKVRPDKIAALEGDDYSRFANAIYAKGFLQIYARFLKVDVSEFARTLDNSNPISVSDYQYLSNAPTPRRETSSHTVSRDERRPPSLAPLFFFVLLIIVAAGGWWAWTQAQRIKTDEINAAAAAAPATPAPNPDAAFVKTSRPPGTGSPVPGTTAAPNPIPAATPKTDQDFVQPSPVATADPSAQMATDGRNEILVATVKTTWVTVRKDDPKAPPIFEDFVYPHAPPLKLKGARFFIEAKDPSSVQITKNGLPFGYQSGSVSVQ